MSDLKPCPICGSTKIEEYDEWVDVGDPYAHITNHIVECRNCNYSRGDCTRDNAIKYWNTRPAEDAKDKEIERLKKDNQVYRDMLNSLLNEEVYHLDNATMTNIKYELDNRGQDTNVPTNAPDTNVGTKGGE